MLLSCLHPNSFRTPRIYTTSLHVSLTAMNSASVLEGAVTDCFNVRHAMLELPNISSDPDVDFLSLLSPAQSASENARSFGLLPVFDIRRDTVSVP